MPAYRTIKRLILWTPTVTIALWEYVRHTVLLPYVSMDLGNLLAPVIVFLVTVTLLRKLFAMLEQTQEALHRERLLKTALEEREQLARELHDGISQSLFLLAAKLDKLERAADAETFHETSGRIRETVRRVHEDVRQSIAGLRQPPAAGDSAWMAAMEAIGDEARDGGLGFELMGRLPEDQLSGKAKIELLAIVREAVLNVRKHASAQSVRVTLDTAGAGGFRCEIADDGTGADTGKLEAKDRFGVKMMRRRAEEMGWLLAIGPRAGGGTSVVIIAGGEDADGHSAS